MGKVAATTGLKMGFETGKQACSSARTQIMPNRMHYRPLQTQNTPNSFFSLSHTSHAYLFSLTHLSFHSHRRPGSPWLLRSPRPSGRCRPGQVRPPAHGGDEARPHQHARHPWTHGDHGGCALPRGYCVWRALFFREERPGRTRHHARRRPRAADRLHRPHRAGLRLTQGGDRGCAGIFPMPRTKPFYIYAYWSFCSTYDVYLIL
jgi:hypothetical protein